MKKFPIISKSDIGKKKLKVSSDEIDDVQESIKESIIKNMIRKAIIDEAKDWPLNLNEVNQNNLYVADQRYVGKYIIWVLSDNKSFRTAIMGKKGFDNFSSNDPDDLFKLWNLAKKFKGKPIPDIATEGLSEGIDVRKWVDAVEKGKDVVVWDKKGKRYNLQGGDNKSVQVTDHWEDAGRRNIHPERTWQELPLSKVKKIVFEGLSEAKLKRFKVFIDGEKEPLILTGKNENDVKKFAHQMIHNNKVKITKVVKEAVTESLKGKFVVASIYGDLYTPTAVGEKQALKLMMKLAKQYAGDNVFVLGAEYWNTHKFNKKNNMVKEGKLNEFNKAHFLNLIQQELDSIKGQKAYVKDKLRDKDLEKWEKKEWNQVWPELVKREKELKIRINNVKQ